MPRDSAAVRKVEHRDSAFRRSFAISRKKRISDADLAKKREGWFVAGIPDVSSDPVSGVGYGARGSIFWNGQRSDPFFAYTPYRAKLRIQAYNTTEEARELTMSLDLPYLRGSRWRIKLDAKAGSSPANLYFGLTEQTLGSLRLPSAANSAAGYTTYEAFDRARKTLRDGSAGEAPRVTDALSNRFGEEELMLNLKADYSLGDGRWRLMAGYEIQRLRYRTFAGRDADALDPVTGAATTAPNGTSLLARDFASGAIRGLDGGRVSLLQQALIYDTRDFEPDPTRGMYAEVGNEWSGSAIGSQVAFDKVFVQVRAYRRLPIGPRTVLAGRVGGGNIFGASAPFFEFQDQWSPEGSINALGGARSLRGYRANRFLGRAMWFSNAELRVRLGEARIGKQRFAVGVAPFVDAGTVRDRWQTLNLDRVRFAQGIGGRLAWNQSTLLSLDYGWSREDRVLFFGLGQMF